MVGYSQRDVLRATAEGMSMQRGFAKALHDLAVAQKKPRGVSLYSRYVNRPAGRVVAAAAFKFRLSPNQLTIASALVTAAGIVVFVSAEPDLMRSVLVAILFVLGFALDSADGQLARLTGQGSIAGEWLDHVVDAVKILAVHSGVLAVGYLYWDLDAQLLLVPLGFQIVGMTIFIGGELARLLDGTDSEEGSITTRPSPIRAIALLPADFGILALTFAIAGSAAAFMTVYTVLFVINAGILALLSVKWYRALS